ncbi:MAG: AraC family transcriptional regulator, partial [Bacteroidetes bacterium]|nr:AraC family transcriptional regulator [Bacteroidota bacterium]
MPNINSLPRNFSQNNRLPIRIVSRQFGHLSPETADVKKVTRLPYYFFLFIVDGSSRYTVDEEVFAVERHELLFSLPQQMLERPVSAHSNDYFKLGFDEECISKLPRQYPFLLNPLNQQKVSFLPAAAARLQAVFIILLDLLRQADTDPELILAHMNALLTEINTAYFALDKKKPGDKLAKFIRFKLFVEKSLTDQPAITDIAEELAVSTDSLY